MSSKIKIGFQSIHQLLSFGRLLRFLIGFVLAVQLIVISYNHLSGYHILTSFDYFLYRLFRGVTLSLFAGFLLAYPNLLMIRILNRVAPWNYKILKRIFIQIIFSVTLAVLVSLIFTLIASAIKPYSEDFKRVVISNMLIFSVVNVFVMAILEGWIFYIKSKRSEKKARNLQEELSQIKYEVLKSQINPHFMFNSLNVLSGMINKDTGKAQQFIDEFSHIYRYVLETIEQSVATLEKEIDFMQSYLFLQQIRYGNDLSYSVNIQADLLKKIMPPLSLQVVLENAIKHNIINEARPLRIEVFSQKHFLIIRNNLQPKMSKNPSTGLGLKNLTKRYAMIGPEEPVFSIDANYYIAKLPLIDIEKDESAYH
ncbi:sensor histidine kinase [Marinilabilia sp.]|uniref:sensor histidine kinase n=1 Tax=Marinilabilia sp. TaxID=2021252 RepID=UPI0025BA0858|nr:histidine kinase [Marinilabilia sp.]